MFINVYCVMCTRILYYHCSSILLPQDIVDLFEKRVRSRFETSRLLYLHRPPPPSAPTSFPSCPTPLPAVSSTSSSSAAARSSTREEANSAGRYCIEPALIHLLSLSPSDLVPHVKKRSQADELAQLWNSSLPVRSQLECCTAYKILNFSF